jgi:hypothetical protein
MIDTELDANRSKLNMTQLALHYKKISNRES